MGDTPKAIKKHLRIQANLAYEEELRRALQPISEAFDKWRAGVLRSGEISDLIHEFHQGPARDIFSRYELRLLEPAVAHAIATGVLNKDTIPAELLDYLKSKIEFYQSEQEIV